MAGIQPPAMTEDDPRWQAAVQKAAAQCVECRPALRPAAAQADAPASDQHVGVRFGNVGPGWQVTLDGHDCTTFTVEADASAGWVIAHVPHPTQPGAILVHLNHPILALLEGTVTVVRPGGLIRV